ncbi:PREDICTED: E3 ubiquitin ligase BIG BROTHER-like isoform X2 [Populus euphratica]|uniref:E3 ubiquitin ligase BIG BROTHER-like isoform X2 n=1 Tax=Populus euphratica TaxID=75702 RepID=A0AAJ6UX86_POPEU|nr:PREDICTED: E3 ubiquitin ligase BIG BROTHER-like isoform X2 [Populus euphratica]
MNWNTHMEGHYMNPSYPYNSAGSFIEYFEGLTYDHVNFIFNGGSHAQDIVYPSTNANFYKFGISPPGRTSYYDPTHIYEFHDNGLRNEEYGRPLENSSTTTNEQISRVNTEGEVNENRTSHDDPVECLRRHHNVQDYQAIWQDNVDLDSMTYEELLELGETVGTQNRGLSQELISLLPISKYNRSFFSRRKSRSDEHFFCRVVVWLSILLTAVISCRTWILCKLLSINKVFMLSASILVYLFSLA